MKVSIITACYNNEDTIGKTIASVVSQSYNNIEHIFIDGLSKDGTLSVIRQMSPNSVIVSEKDSGIYDALNKGIAKASGDIIGILHADDFYASDNVIANVVEKFRSTHADAIYGDLMYVDRLQPEKIIRNWKSGEYKEGAFLWGWMPPHPTFFVRKEIYDKYGSFNLKLRSAADYELMLRYIHKQGIKLAYLKEVLVKMRVGGQSNVSLSNRIKANREDRQAWELNGMKPYWFTRFIKPIRKISQFFSKK